MHDDGEVDARGTYTVIAVASLLNMLTPELSEGVAGFAVSGCGCGCILVGMCFVWRVSIWWCCDLVVRLPS